MTVIFKQTEVGYIPAEWQVFKISEIANILTGSTPSIANKSNYGEDFMFVTPADLGQTRFITDTERKLSASGFLQARKFPENSILYTCIGSTIGKSGIAAKPLTSNQQINAILPNNSYNSDYLYYILNFYSEKIKQSAGETAVPIINKTDFGNIKVPLPPTKIEQTAIATALSDADALITSLERLIAKKKAIKQGAMQRLLKPKEGWKIKKLGDLASSIASGKSKTQSNGSKFPIYGSTGVLGWSDKFDYEGKRILIARVGANAGTVNKVNGNCCISDNTLTLVFPNSLDITFMFYKLIAFQLNSLVFGSGQPLITGGQLKSLEIAFPKNQEEQTHIAQILSDMDAEIILLEQKLEKYKLIKQGMMQVLLTGKVRLL